VVPSTFYGRINIRNRQTTANQAVPFWFDDVVTKAYPRVAFPTPPTVAAVLLVIGVDILHGSICSGD